MVVGFLGTFLPVLPGTTLIYAGILIHFFFSGRNESGLGWIGLTVISIFWVLTILLDWVAGAMGAKWFGSSRWGIFGAIIGGIVGIFFLLPGMILGPIIGVFVAEMLFARKRIRSAASSTVGTVVGSLVGLLAKLVFAGGMIAWFIADVFVLN
jgi:uncharacterized protein YqgC (DUF456 family)